MTARRLPTARDRKELSASRLEDHQVEDGEHGEEGRPTEDEPRPGEAAIAGGQLPPAPERRGGARAVQGAGGAQPGARPGKAPGTGWRTTQGAVNSQSASTVLRPAAATTSG